MKTFCKISLILSLLIGNVTWAGDSKKIELDLEKDSTAVVTGELNVLSGRWTYFVDPTACICWITGSNGGVAIVECKKLKAHTKLAPHVQKCM